MREHLLGYLLEDLEPGESKQVAEALASDERLQRDLELLREVPGAVGRRRRPSNAT